MNTSEVIQQEEHSWKLPDRFAFNYIAASLPQMFTLQGRLIQKVWAWISEPGGSSTGNISMPALLGLENFKFELLCFVQNAVIVMKTSWEIIEEKSYHIQFQRNSVNLHHSIPWGSTFASIESARFSESFSFALEIECSCQMVVMGTFANRFLLESSHHPTERALAAAGLAGGNPSNSTPSASWTSKCIFFQRPARSAENFFGTPKIGQKCSFSPFWIFIPPKMD